MGRHASGETNRTRRSMRSRTVVVVNPSPDVYGADLQMLQTVTGLIADGWRVVVVLPDDGELVTRIKACGAEVRVPRVPRAAQGQCQPAGAADHAGPGGRLPSSGLPASPRHPPVGAVREHGHPALVAADRPVDAYADRRPPPRGRDHGPSAGPQGLGRPAPSRRRRTRHQPLRARRDDCGAAAAGQARPAHLQRDSPTARPAGRPDPGGAAAAGRGRSALAAQGLAHCS